MELLLGPTATCLWPSACFVGRLWVGGHGNDLLSAPPHPL
jgi:hypothetical protein